MLFGLPPIHADYTDFTARAAIVEGYNSNVYEKQDDPNVLIVNRHPSPFTGVDAMVQARVTGSGLDIHDFRLQARAQHYEPLTSAPQTDDGSVNAAWTSRVTLSPRTFITLGAIGTYSSVNASHASDGNLFQFDPTNAQRTYWLGRAEASLTHELAPTVRIRERIAFGISGTVRDLGLPLANGDTLVHRGLDYYEMETETSLIKDFSDRMTGDLRFLFQRTYDKYLLDLTLNPPGSLPPYTLDQGTLTAGVLYRFTPELINRVSAGASLASSPPQSVDTGAVLAPTFSDQLFYTRELWYLTATASYMYSSLNPRIGAGPALLAAVALVGTPVPHGGWRRLALMINAQAGHTSALIGANSSTSSDTVAGAVQLRYALNGAIGLLAGYDLRYSDINGPQYFPPFFRSVVFLGVSGYWSTDGLTPPLTTFQAPIVPPG